MLLFGGAAAKHILDTSPTASCAFAASGARLHDRSRKIKTIATLHPAYLLRTPAAKRQAWRDLLAVRVRPFKLDQH